MVTKRSQPERMRKPQLFEPMEAETPETDAPNQNEGPSWRACGAHIPAPTRDVTHSTLQRAAAFVGRKLQIENVQVGRRPKSLDQPDRAAVGLVGLEARLIQQVARDHTLHDLQHRR